jgi:predicted membrane protein
LLLCRIFFLFYRTGSGLPTGINYFCGKFKNTVMNFNRNKLGLLLLALLVLAAGALLLGYYAGFLSDAAKSIIFSWQTLLIALGIILLSPLHPNHRTPGAVLIIVGVAFLLPLILGNCCFFYGNGKALSWAILLILLGLYILFKAIFGKQHQGCCSKGYAHTRISKGETGYIDRNFVFGGGEDVIDISDFKGGEINCVFGGANLDFTRAQLAEGVHTLGINTVFGGVTLRIPPHWKVELRPTCIFGGFEDKRRQISTDSEENKTLIIVVSAVFGGGEIRS